MYEFGPFRLNVQERLLSRDGEQVPLTPKVFDVLVALVQGHGQILGKDQLMQSVWADCFVEESNLTQDISVLRRVLGNSDDHHRYIQTIPRRGYRFAAPITELRNEAVVTGGLAVERATLRRPLVWAAAAAAVLMVAAIGILIGGKWPVPVERVLVPVPITSYPGNEVQPTFSPDGNQIAFVWDGERQDNPDIYVKIIGIGSDSPRRLTTHPASDISPAWSPDGRFIAFVRKEYDGAPRTSVFIIPAIGGPEYLVTEMAYSLPVSLFSPHYTLNMPFPLLAWTPNCKSLVVVDRLSPQEPLALFLVSLASREKIKLTSPPGGSIGDSAPAISPDGGSLLFSRTEDRAGSNLYRVSLSDGTLPRGEPQRLTSSETWHMTPAWFADGRQILFSRSANLAKGLSLWTMRPEPGAKERMLVTFGEDSGWPAISAAKSRLVFARQYSDSNVWRLPLRDRTAAGPPEKVIYSMRDDGLAQYSPDGTKIVFTTNRTGIFEVWVCESDGSNGVQIATLGKGVAGNPRWAPDGKQIVFDSNADGNWDIYTISATGGGLRRLTSRRANVMGSFSRDGSHIYFRSNRSGTWQIWRMPADGGEATQLTRNGGMSPVESIDGKFVYYATGGHLWKVSVQGGEESEVLQSIWASNYAIGHEGIYFMTMPDLAHNKNSIQFFSFESGKASAVAAIPGIPGWGFSVSPDEKFLTYTQMDQLGSDLMLVENFR